MHMRNEPYHIAKATKSHTHAGRFADPLLEEQNKDKLRPIVEEHLVTSRLNDSNFVSGLFFVVVLPYVTKEFFQNTSDLSPQYQLICAPTLLRLSLSVPGNHLQTIQPSIVANTLNEVRES